MPSIPKMIRQIGITGLTSYLIFITCFDYARDVGFTNARRMNVLEFGWGSLQFGWHSIVGAVLSIWEKIQHMM